MLRQLTRTQRDIEAAAVRLLPLFTAALTGAANVSVVGCKSQIGSGAMPVDLLPSAGLRLAPSARNAKRKLSAGRLASALRRLPLPVIGRIHKGAVILDLRCLTAAKERAMTEHLPKLAPLLEEAGDV